MNNNDIWELIVRNEKLIWSVVHKYAKFNLQDIYQDSLIGIYKKLAKYKDVNQSLFVSIIHSSVVNAITTNYRFCKDICCDSDELAKKSATEIVTNMRGSGIYAA
jgi:hypothetical protein